MNVDSLFNSIWEFWYIMLVVFIMGRFIYYPNNGKKEFLFTFLMLAAALTLICMLVSRVELGLGFALGIFAVFGVIRYRTTQISPREMTYIFLTAAISAKNSLITDEVLMSRMFLSDAFILISAGLCEYFLFRNQMDEKLIIYDKLELIHPENRIQLIEDLGERFGLENIEKVKIGRIDAPKECARLKVYFKDKQGGSFSDD